MSKFKISLVLNILLIGFIAVMAYKFIVIGSTVASEDGRAAVLLTEGERNKVLGEMRIFLEGVQTITTAIAENDMDTVAKTSTSMGMAAVANEDPAFMAKLPLEFKTLGMATHQLFDDLAALSEVAENPSEVSGALGELLNNCTTCHAGNRFVTEAMMN